MKIAKTLASCALVFLCAQSIFSQNSRPVASTISAVAGQNKAIEISWQFPKNTQLKITSAKIYRGSKPFTSYRQIEGNSPIAEITANSYTDTVTHAGEYFYAVIATTVRGDYKTIIPGMNATVNGARPKIQETQKNKKTPEIPAKQTSLESPAQSTVAPIITPSPKAKPSSTAQKTPPLRKTPLPFPGTILGIDHERAEISAKAKQSVEDLGKKKSAKAPQIKVPYFFEEDMFSPDGGDEYTLFETLRAGLVQRKYKESVDFFNDFLSVNRNKEVANRALFYLGESYYFCKDYESAIHCFLSVQEVYPELSKKWIDSSLDSLEIEN